MVIRSYRRVFRIERRIYKFGDWTIPAPNGIPLRGLVYWAAALVVILLLGQLPLTELFVANLPWPLRLIIIPLWVAAAGMMFEPDGQRSHDWLLTAARYLVSAAVERVTARRTERWDGKLRIRWDEHDAALHRADVHGPAVIYFREPIQLADRWDGWCAETRGARDATTVHVRADQTLRIKP